MILVRGLKILLFLAMILTIYVIVHCPLASATTITYSYYATDELLRSSYSTGTTVTYEYDISGNRLSKVVATSAAAPSISVVPDSLNFGTVALGSVFPAKTVTITNTGTGPLNISSVSLVGTNASSFQKQSDTCSGQSILPAGFCVVNITFSPVAPAGTDSATLQILSNDPGTPTTSVALNGIGTSSYFALTITKTGQGTGTVSLDTGILSWNGNIGTANLASGSSASIFATPASSSSFDGWTGGCFGNGSPCSVVMSTNMAVTAIFGSKADFYGTPLSGVTPLSVTFTDSSASSPTAWLWDFGDGSTSTLKNPPAHIYSTPGSFTVELTVTGTDGQATVTKTGYINAFSCSSTEPILWTSSGGNNYPTIQAAYDVADNGDAVKMQALNFGENLLFMNNPSILLQGGFGCDYTSNPGYTTINGSLIISGGTVTVENLVIQ